METRLKQMTFLILMSAHEMLDLLLIIFEDSNPLYL